MVRPLSNSSPAMNIASRWRPSGQGPNPDLEVRIGYAVRHIEAHAAWKHQVHIRELRVTEVEDGWRLMFKGDRDGKPVVSYIYNDTYLSALTLGLTTLDLGQCSWEYDKYPPKRYGSPPVALRF